MDYEFFAHSDTGLMRDNNEDSVAFDAAAGLAVLADGMGGYNAGEVAAGMATGGIVAELGRWLNDTGRQALPRDIKQAMEICTDNTNRAIYRAALDNAQYAGMGTTLVMGVFRGERALFGHVGDSRAYRWRKGTLTQLTHDHSLLQEHLDAGLITPEQALTAAHRNLVTRAVGVEDVVVLEVREYRVEPGDLYLLCSDGLTDMITDPEIEAMIGEAEQLPDVAQHLIAAANLHGGRDNISVLLVRASRTASRPGFLSRLLGK